MTEPKKEQWEPVGEVAERDKSGRFKPGEGGKKGLRKKKMSSTEARENLPRVIRRMIDLACKDDKWLAELKAQDPKGFATLMVSLSRYDTKNDKLETGESAQEVITHYITEKEAILDDLCFLLNMFIKSGLLPEEFRDNPKLALGLLAENLYENEVTVKIHHESEAEMSERLHEHYSNMWHREQREGKSKKEVKVSKIETLKGAVKNLFETPERFKQFMDFRRREKERVKQAQHERSEASKIACRDIDDALTELKQTAPKAHKRMESLVDAYIDEQITENEFHTRAGELLAQGEKEAAELKEKNAWKSQAEDRYGTYNFK